MIRTGLLSLAGMLGFAAAYAAETKQEAQEPAAPAGLVVGEPICHGNLTVFPLRSRVAKNFDRFITLDEGLRAGTIEIREIGSGGEQDAPTTEPQVVTLPNPPAIEQNVPDPPQASVNRLVVINRSTRPLYLMPGEVIIGGKQDRTIGQEAIIAADGKAVDVGVFCVEHGRWSSQDESALAARLHGASSGVVANLSVAIDQNQTTAEAAEAANDGKFVASAGALHKAGRVAVQAKNDQQAVWQEVAANNAISGAQRETGTFTENYTRSDLVQRLEDYVNAVTDPVTKTENVVGVIVAVNGQIDTMDSFESTPLFKELWPKLVKSYALDAANRADSSGKAKTCSKADAEKFLAEAARLAVETREKSAGVSISRRSEDRLLAFSVDYEAADEAPADEEREDGDGFGGGVHDAAFAQ